jgi:peptide/nickel transport system substrate-binding protein
MRPSSAAVLLWLLIALVVGCAPMDPGRAGSAALGASTPAPMRRIAVAITGEPRTLSSTLAELTPGGGVRGLGEVEQLLHVGLANASPQGRLSPRLAEAVPTVENGGWVVLPDGRMQTTWTLRPGAQWHDGAPFTTDDLLFTLAVCQDPELPIVRRRVAYAAIDTAEATDPRTLVVSWKQPFIEADTLFTHLLAMPMPKHLLEKPYAANKPNLLDLAYWNQEFVGAGPYRLRSWEASSHLLLGAFDAFALGRPRIDEIEVKFIPDSTTRMSNILSGAVDMTMGLGLSMNQGVELRDRWSAGRLAVSLTNARALHPQLLNPSPAIIADVRFRRALVQAIDRQELADTLQLGFSAVPHSFLNPSEPEYEPEPCSS